MVISRARDSLPIGMMERCRALDAREFLAWIVVEVNEQFCLRESFEAGVRVEGAKRLRFIYICEWTIQY